MSKTLPLSLLPGTVGGALAVIDEAVAEHRPSKVFAAFSGGHDSLVAAHIASRHPRFSGAVHINTTIGIEETREFVRQTCRRYGWPLQELYPPPGDTYEDIILGHGMPGPNAHLFTYIRLKERAIRSLIRENKDGTEDRIVLVTGVRSAESKRRMGSVKPIDRDGALVWVAPCHDWGSAEREDYIDSQGLPRNPVVANLHMSGECLCGAYAHPGELDEVGFFYPAVAARIRHLERAAAEHGLPCKWGERPPGSGSGVTRNMPLCVGCEQRMLAIEEAMRP